MTVSTPSSLPVGPGGTIGILGGGQLGRMLSLAAAKLGLKTHIYSDKADAPALDVAALRTTAPLDDKSALAQFARSCDAITFEFENIPAAALALLAGQMTVPARPGNPGHLPGPDQGKAVFRLGRDRQRAVAAGGRIRRLGSGFGGVERPLPC